MTTPLTTLFDSLKAFDRPPVETWFPTKTIDFDLLITASGDWIHEGSAIKRHKLVKLFSTVIALRQDEYYLVTPPAKYRIKVEDAPFLAVELTMTGQGRDQRIFLRSNMDEIAELNADHPFHLRPEPGSGELLPYFEIRDGLIAKPTRSVYYQLVDLCVAKERKDIPAEEFEINNNEIEQYGVYSGGQYFPLN